MNFEKIETKWQKKWEKAKVFEPKVDSKKKKFFFTVPYPYVNAPLHIGHGRTYSIGDAFFRYHKMSGTNALWPMAYHLTGTPVLAVSHLIKTGDKKKIEQYKKYIGIYEKDKKKINQILKSFEKPENVAKYFASVMKQDFKKMGYAIDFTREFTTMDPDYNAFINWQFQKYKEKGFLTKGSHPILYCEVCKSAVGEDDIQDGDQIKAAVEEYTALKFKLGSENQRFSVLNTKKCSKNEYLIAATLRPETVFGQTNLWVDPKVEYVKVKVGKEIWIMSKEAAEKLKHQKDAKIVGKIKGSALIDKKVIAPMIHTKIPILPSKFCDPTIGSGIVTSVPSDAPHDYMGLVDLWNKGKYKEIKVIPIIEIPGHGDQAAVKICKDLKIKNQLDKKLEDAKVKIYKLGFHTGKMNKNCGKYSGMAVTKAKDKVKNEMLKSGDANIFYEVDALQKPVKCRCNGNVLVSILKDQWFLQYSNPKWKAAAEKALKKVIIHPNEYKKSFETTFDWLDKRPCARRRGLGTKLPFDKEWIIESLSDSTIYMAFYIIKKKINEFKLKPKQLTNEFWDYVLLGKGKCNTVPKNQLNEIKKEFEYWYPNDQRHTGIGHISNHLSFFLFAHAAIFPENKWPKAITLNEFLIKEGEKMSKSKGNVIPLAHVPQLFGADLYRLYCCYATELNSVLDFKQSEVETIKKKINWFYIFLTEKQKTSSKKTKFDEWIISKLNNAIKQAKEHMKKYELRNYVQKIFFSFIKNLNYYLANTTPNTKTLQEIKEKIILMMTPITPYVCEESWEQLGNKRFVSTALLPKSGKINAKLEKEFELLENIKSDTKTVLQLANIKPKKITLIIAPEWKRKVLKSIAKISNPNELMKKAMQDSDVRKNGKQAAKFIQYVSKHLGEFEQIISEKEELQIVNSFKDQIKKEFGAQVEIVSANKTDLQKKHNAIPMKPAIFVE